MSLDILAIELSAAAMILIGAENRETTPIDHVYQRCDRVYAHMFCVLKQLSCLPFKVYQSHSRIN